MAELASFPGHTAWELLWV